MGVSSANEGALYPRIVAAGPMGKLTFQVGKASSVARKVSLRSSNAAVKVPASQHRETTTLSVAMATLKMRVTLRAVPMK